MNQTIEVQVRIVYGVPRIYPISDNAKKLAEFIGRKTFNESDITKLKDIGFSIKWVPINL